MRAAWRGAVAGAGLCAAVALPAADGGTIAGGPTGTGPATGRPPPVAVASSLRFAWPELVEIARHTAPTAARGAARPSFGASLALAGQMLEGAPFELLVAADVESVERLVTAGIVAVDAVTRYADGTLALAVRSDSPLAPAPTLEALAALLAAEPTARIAIAHPERAPYGRAALEALDSAGLGALAPTRVARGENAGQALQYLLAGAVDAALVPLSLVVGAPDGTAIVARAVASDRHAPIEHALGAVRSASSPALALARFLSGCTALAVLERHGFSAPAGVACRDGADGPGTADRAEPTP